jgi:hypothetical protein
MFICIDSSPVSRILLTILCDLSSAFASLHNVGACVTNRKYDVRGGTGWSVSYNYGLTYEIDTGVTQCACDFYRRRNTGNQWWDKCPDCSFVRSLFNLHGLGKCCDADVF